MDKSLKKSGRSSITALPSGNSARNYVGAIQTTSGKSAFNPFAPQPQQPVSPMMQRRNGGGRNNNELAKELHQMYKSQSFVLPNTQHNSQPPGSGVAREPSAGGAFSPKQERRNSSTSSNRSFRATATPMLNNKLPITFAISEAENVNKKYTMYLIDIVTFWESWTVRRRYREFRTLYTQFKQIDIMKKEIEHIKFPKKAMFKLRGQIIKDRMQALQDFMNALCNCSHETIIHLLENQDFCTFIEIDDMIKGFIIQHFFNQEQAQLSRLGLLTLSRSVLIPQQAFSLARSDSIRLSKRASVTSGGAGTEPGAEPKVEIFEQEEIQVQKLTLLQKAQNGEATPEGILVDFLFQINEASNDEKLNAVREFEEYYLKFKPNYPEDSIAKLFIGDILRTKGVLHFVGYNSGSLIETDQHVPQFTESLKRHHVLNFPTEDVENSANFPSQFLEEHQRQQLLLSGQTPLAIDQKLGTTHQAPSAGATAANAALIPTTSTENFYYNEDTAPNSLPINYVPKTSTMLAVTCLKLISKLLNYQINPQAEMYIRIFSKQDKLLIKSMRLEQFLMAEKRYAQEAYILLDNYMTRNPQVQDMRELMSDEQAIEKFRRWSKQRKGIRDTVATIPNTEMRKSNFMIKRHKSTNNRDSLFSAPSDDNGGIIITENSTIKRQQAQEYYMMEEQKTQPPIQVLQLVQQMYPSVVNLAELREELLEQDNNQFTKQASLKSMQSYTIEGSGLTVSRNDRGLYLVNIETQIEFDEFYHQVQNTMFLQRILSSNYLQIIQIDSPDDFIELYQIVFLESRGAGSVSQSHIVAQFDNQDLGDSIFITFSELKQGQPVHQQNNNTTSNNFLVIQIYPLLQGETMEAEKTTTSPNLFDKMHVVKEEIGLEDEEANMTAEFKRSQGTGTNPALSIEAGASSKRGGRLLGPASSNAQSAASGGSNLGSSQRMNSQPNQTRGEGAVSSSCEGGVLSKSQQSGVSQNNQSQQSQPCLVGVRVVCSQGSSEGLRNGLFRNISRLREVRFYQSNI